MLRTVLAASVTLVLFAGAGLVDGQDKKKRTGMLTGEQMAALTAARGAEFDRLFLGYMIRHHEGALTMVAQLFGSTGSGQQSEIYQFASDVEADQSMEISRMKKLLEGR